MSKVNADDHNDSTNNKGTISNNTNNDNNNDAMLAEKIEAVFTDISTLMTQQKSSLLNRDVLSILENVLKLDKTLE